MNDETKNFNWLKRFRFLITPEHPCSYIADREATTLFVDPQEPMDKQKYSQLAELGFRRSGEHVYRPQCAMCSECKLVRILVDDFKPSRSQKRVLRLNKDVSFQWGVTTFNEEHFLLYRSYMRQRHAGSSMDDDDPMHYMHVMAADWCETRLGEFRLGDRLVAIAITDVLENGLSAVYTFFDAAYTRRSLGTLAILTQINAAQEEALDYVYLGYWINSCSKMSYKIRFNASEIFNGHRWYPKSRFDFQAR